MKVKELIEILQQYDSNEHISILDFEENCYYLTQIKYDKEYGVCLQYD